MAPNIGTVDRGFRFVLGIILLAVPFVSNMTLFESGAATGLSVIVGLVMIATSAMKVCPLYSIFGLRTCKT